MEFTKNNENAVRFLSALSYRFGQLIEDALEVSAEKVETAFYNCVLLSETTDQYRQTLRREAFEAFPQAGDLFWALRSMCVEYIEAEDQTVEAFEAIEKKHAEAEAVVWALEDELEEAEAAAEEAEED